MLRHPVTLLTGASGEVGTGLIERLGRERALITLDLQPLADGLRPYVRQHFVGSVLDAPLLERVLAEYEVDRIFHLAALLSTRCEFTPVTAHRVNVEGMIQMLEFAQKQGESHGRPVAFVYPSSIAAFGLPDAEAKRRAGRVTEDQFNHPITMYGCNKLYCEQVGRYYALYYKQLSAGPFAGKVDFRCLRFPGLISAATVPSGGTSDYAPEMLHAAAQGEAYACFVRPDTRIPFMAMPDAVEALLQLAAAPRERLRQPVYNVGAFSVSAEEVAALVRTEFPKADISTKVDAKRQRIVDSWPEDVDDAPARRDWGLSPRYDLRRAFAEYLIPGVKQRYS
jgi:threonine 3-dehydrogenase